MADKQVPTFGSSHIDQPHETGHSLIIREADVLASRHYYLDDIGECFSSDDLKRMDSWARDFRFHEIGTLWSLRTANYRAKAFANAKYFLEEDEAIRLSEKPEDK